MPSWGIPASSGTEATAVLVPVHARSTDARSTTPVVLYGFQVIQLTWNFRSASHEVLLQAKRSKKAGVRRSVRSSFSTTRFAQGSHQAFSPTSIPAMNPSRETRSPKSRFCPTSTESRSKGSSSSGHLTTTYFNSLGLPG